MRIRHNRIAFKAIFLILPCLFFGLFTFNPLLAQEKASIKLGFFPIVSTVALFKRFAPLRDYLSEQLGREVELETAKDFPTFLKRTDQRQYDLVVTAPHFVVRAVDSGKYRVIATPVNKVQQLFVVREGSDVKSPVQLAGKHISTPPVPALMTMMGKQFLADAGLNGDRSPDYRAFTSHNAANEALLAGDVDAAIASSNIVYKAIKRGEPLHIAFEGLSLPSMGWMAASDIDQEIGVKVQQILTNMNHNAKGKKVLDRISFPGFKAVDAQYYEPARPFMEQAREMARKKGSGQ